VLCTTISLFVAMKYCSTTLDFSDSDEDYSDSETMVRSPPKKPKKNNLGPKYASHPGDDLSDDNNAILTPVIRTSDTTAMQPAPPIMVRTNTFKGTLGDTRASVRFLWVP
jgi:hypothetical protein